jgi:hypothetical protein
MLIAPLNQWFSFGKLEELILKSHFQLNVSHEALPFFGLSGAVLSP